MFSACPHCGYLIALIDGALPALCPKCGGSLAKASEVEGSVVDTYSIRSRHKKSQKRAPDQSQATLNIDPLPRSAPTPGATDETLPHSPRSTAAAAASRQVPPVATPAPTVSEPVPATQPAAMPTLTRSPAEQMAEVFGGKSRPTPPSAEVIERARQTLRAHGAASALGEPLPVVATAAAGTTSPANDGATAQVLRQLRGTPSFARRQMAAARAHGHDPLRIAVIVMALLLVLQILLAKRDDMAASARWRPVASVMCTMLFCKLPAWHEPRAFTLVQRNVRPHATTPGVLSVSASFRNDARWAQAWPTLILSLSDVDGRQVGTRSFQPDEYRPAGASQTLEPGQSTQVQFDVIEPAPRIVAFNFDFR